MATSSNPKASRRKRRWGDGPSFDNKANGNGGGGDDNGESSKRKSRFSTSPPSANAGGSDASPVVSTGSAAPPPPPSSSATNAAADPKARAAALQASIQARLVALKARKVGGGGVAAKPSATRTPPQPTTTTTTRTQLKRAPPASQTGEKSTKRAKVFELDMTTTAPTRLIEKKQQREEQLSRGGPRAKINPYLAHAVDEATMATSGNKDATTGGTADAQPEAEELLLDNRLASSAKQRLKSRPINFVAPGTYIALGEKKREQAARAEESGFLSGRKVGNVVKSVGMAGVGATEADGGEGGESTYGAGQAGKAVEQRLPARVDAPELELEVYAGKKTILTSVSDVDVERNDAAVIAAAQAATSSMPYAMEWWDAELLPSKLRKELAGEEGRAIASRAKKGGGGGKQSKREERVASANSYEDRRRSHVALVERCYQHASLAHSKTHALLQHPVPVLTPAQRAAAEALKAKPPTLHLTKAERKRHRKLRRAERLREQQDLQAAGLVPPPEPRLTLSNYMRVLGDQAVLDPSKMEATVMEQVRARKLAHEKMNADRMLSKEQRSAKHARKLAEDTSQSVKVALFWVRDVSHPYHRAKVDLNAQQNSITGGVLECEEGSDMNLVVAEGGEKAIKRYTRLMTVRMRWKGEDFYEEESEEEEELMVGEDEENAGGDREGDGAEKKEKRKRFNPNNECELIWTGMAVKRAFHSFMFQTAPNSVVARKILEAKGVAHYWDLCVGHVERKEGVVGGHAGGDGEGGEGALRFRLGDGGSDGKDGGEVDNMME